MSDAEGAAPGAAPGPSGRPDPLAPLLRGALDGDRAAMQGLLRAVSPSVLWSVRAVLGPSSPDIDDVAQEALVALVHALRAFRGESRVATYAARIALRSALYARRRSTFRGRKMDDYQRLESAPGSARPPEPVDDAIAGERQRLVRELLDELPEAQAETLTLRVMLDYSLDEVAEAMSVPTNTVRSRMRLAREAMRRRIAESPRLGELLQVIP